MTPITEKWSRYWYQVNSFRHYITTIMWARKYIKTRLIFWVYSFFTGCGGGCGVRPKVKKVVCLCLILFPPLCVYYKQNSLKSVDSEGMSTASHSPSPSNAFQYEFLHNSSCSPPQTHAFRCKYCIWASYFVFILIFDGQFLIVVSYSSTLF